MPRNGSGVYSKPAGTTAVPNATIESAKFNQVVDDLVQDANFARPVTAGGTGASTENDARTSLSVDKKVILVAKSGNYTAVADDNNATLFFSAAATLSLTAAATLGANWHLSVMADGGEVTIDPSSTEQINGALTFTVPKGVSADIICNGTAFYARYSYRNLSGWEPIGGVINAAGLSVIDWTNLSAFTRLSLVFDGRLTASASSGLFFRVSSDNGASFISGGSDYSYASFCQEGTTLAGTSDTPISYGVASVTGINSASPVQAEIDIGSFNRAEIGVYDARSKYIRNGANSRKDNAYGYLANIVARNAVRFGCLTGTFASGRAQLFGIRG